MRDSDTSLGLRLGAAAAAALLLLVPFALVAVLVTRRQARRKLAAEGTPVLPLREALAARRRRRAR